MMMPIDAMYKTPTDDAIRYNIETGRQEYDGVYDDCQEGLCAEVDTCNGDENTITRCEFA